MLVSRVYMGLGVVSGGDRRIVYIVFARDLWILLLSGIALRFTSFRNLQPNIWGKVNTFVQIAAAVVVIAANAYFDSTLTLVGGGLMYLVAAFSIVSGTVYTLRGLLWLRKGSVKESAA